ncbi:type II secretion system protein [Chitinibacter sp. GC72]|uniref:type II secretion system protein n=1 Tax=Chitinibacter sp. GC72 TaxID=1526917 RepID=UPI0018DFF364|nr:type II secretion system protein [Chitinibacter sp. GC72]
MARFTIPGKQPASQSRLKRTQQGFAYMWALMMVLVMSIYLGQVGEAWQNRIQRAKEEELLRMGAEIKMAVKRYNENNIGDNPQTAYPKTLQDLVQDPRVAFPKRYLRKAYKDPITGDDWQYIGAPGGGFVGVASKSVLKPLKNANFPEDTPGFVDAKSYQDWRFAHWPNRGGGRR